MMGWGMLGAKEQGREISVLSLWDQQVGVSKDVTVPVP